jgi:hypothetical protein
MRTSLLLLSQARFLDKIKVCSRKSATRQCHPAVLHNTEWLAVYSTVPSPLKIREKRELAGLLV